MSTKAGESLSLETLLEAAKFVEHNNSPDSQTRVPTPPEFHHYAKSAPSPDSRERQNSNSERSDKDESGADDSKDKRRMGGYGTREVHNKLEKNRRAHLKDCFENLKSQVPYLDEKNLKTSNLAILRGALKHIQALKKKEVELEQELQQLAYIKIQCQQRLSHLRVELCAIDVDMAKILAAVDEEDTHSVSTATADEDGPILSDVDDDDDEPPAKIIRTIIVSPTTNTLTTSPSLALAHNDVVISKNDKVEVRSVATTHKIPTHKLPTALGDVPLLSQTTTTTSKRPQTIASLTAGQSLKGIPRSFTVTQTVSKPTTVMNIPLGTALSTLTKPANPSTTTHIGQLLLQKQIAQCPTQVAASTGKTTTITMTNNKTPVTQILQQAITQRVQQQQQQQQQQQLIKQLQQSGFAGMSVVQGQIAPQLAMAAANSTPQLITVAGSANAIRPVATATLKPIATQIRPAGITLNQVLPNIANNPTPHILTASATNATLSQAPSLFTLNKLINAALSTSTATTTAVTPSLIPTTSGAPATMKHILTVPLTHFPAAQIVSQSTINQLMTQTINKNNAQVLSTSTNPAGLTQIITPAASHSGTLQANLATLPLMSPVTVMSPAGLQVAQATGIQQAQLGVGSQILKPLGQIPILQSMPLKPVVMVTVPNVVASTTTAPTMTLAPTAQAVQLNLAITTRPS